ncbi:MAG: isomerizing glutamine--fructose-6-phosphate transaminase [Candidatus Korobacteraceae bacterium]
MATPDKGSFPHFLIKEIHEQPEAMRNTTLAYTGATASQISFAEVRIGKEELRKLSKLNIAASGTSRHAGIAGRTIIQELAHIPVEVDYASEFEHRNVPGRDELTVVITQSGETADTLSALRKAKAQGARTLAITNVVGSTIAREADAALYTHAGPEISIASTKAFVAQLTVLYLLAMYLGEARGTLDSAASRTCLAELAQIPDKIALVLKLEEQCRELARDYESFENFMFLGRGIHYAMAMDGALKLKETSYVHAEGYPTGEIKHGPFALVDERLVVIVLATRDLDDQASRQRWEKTLTDMRDIKQQGAKVIAVAVEGDHIVSELANSTVVIPRTSELLLPILEVVPLQLFAYFMAVARGNNVDQPRNLVKAVIS